MESQELPRSSFSSMDSSSSSSSSSSLSSSSSRPLWASCQHLIVLQHGLHGSPGDLAPVERCLASRFPDDAVEIYNSTAVEGIFGTHSGVDVGGRLLYDEIVKIATRLRWDLPPPEDKPRTLSMVGHSLGGIYVRYCIGLMEENQFFSKFSITPLCFVTAASPHLGVRGLLNIAAVSDSSLLGSVGGFLQKFRPASFLVASTSQAFVTFFFGRTGRQLMLLDDENLLQTMASPDSSFTKGLRRFFSHHLLSNLNEDIQVPYFSSSITFDFNGKELKEPSIFIEKEFEDHEVAAHLSKEALSPELSPPFPPFPELACLDEKFQVVQEMQASLSSMVCWKRAHFDFGTLQAHIYAVNHPNAASYISKVIHGNVGLFLKERELEKLAGGGGLDPQIKRDLELRLEEQILKETGAELRYELKVDGE